MGNKKNDSALKYIRTINRCNNQLHYLSSILDKGINLDNVTFFKQSLTYELTFFYMNFVFSLLFEFSSSVTYNFVRSFLISIGILGLSSNPERFDNTNYELYKDIALNSNLSDKKMDKICKKFKISKKAVKKCFNFSSMFYLFGADISSLESRSIVNKIFTSDEEIYLYDAISLFIHNLNITYNLYGFECSKYKVEKTKKLDNSLFNLGRKFEKTFEKRIEKPLLNNVDDQINNLKKTIFNLEEFKDVLTPINKEISFYLIDIFDIIMPMYRTLLMLFTYKNYLGIVFSFKPLIENLVMIYFLSKNNLEDCAIRLEYYDILTTYINTKDNIEIENIVKGKNDSFVSIIDDSYKKYYKKFINYNFYDFKNIIFSDPTYLLLLNRDSITGRVERLFSELLTKEDSAYMKNIYTKSIRLGHNDGFLYFYKDKYEEMSISIVDTINAVVDGVIDNTLFNVNKFKDIKKRDDIICFIHKLVEKINEVKKEIEECIN